MEHSYTRRDLNPQHPEYKPRNTCATDRCLLNYILYCFQCNNVRGIIVTGVRTGLTLEMHAMKVMKGLYLDTLECTHALQVRLVQ